MAGRYDHINGAWTQVKKRYDKINGAWVPVRSRYDRSAGAWSKSYVAATLGDNYIFGGHNYKIVNIDASSGQAIIVCQDDLGTREWGQTYENDWSNSSVCWIRTYLNSDFYNALPASDKAKIVTRTNKTYTNSTGQGAWRTLITTNDNIWLLSYDEIFGGFLPQLQWFAQHNTDAERKAFFSPTGSYMNTFLRTGTYADGEKCVDSCNNDGELSYPFASASLHFHPAILINP